MNLRDLIETPYQVRRLAADMVITAVLFADRPAPETALMQACLPGLLRYVADLGGSLRDAANILKHPAHLVAALQAAIWEIDDDVLDSLKQPESGLLLRQWSAIVAALSDSPTISEELERVRPNQCPRIRTKRKRTPEPRATCDLLMGQSDGQRGAGRILL